MKYEIKKFECEKGKMITIKFLDHFERDIEVNEDINDSSYNITVHGKYLESNENYHFLEWLEQGSRVNTQPDRRIFGIVKKTIIDFKIHG